ncbi:MAG: alpha/beta fold hydrolase [Corynebacteriales bacterium]|nr:alpha/beta fold hydrolase [Mycobacteriales bacterium]
MSENHSVVTTDGTRLAVSVRGRGPALLLLAGQSNDHTWWDGVREDLGVGRTTVAVDYRGTGGSDSPEMPYSTPMFADDAVAVLDDLGIADAAVYGTSMGGRVAQWVAANHPQRVTHLILGCTTPGDAHGVPRSAEVRRALAHDRSQEVLTDLMYTPRWRAAHPGPYRTLGDPTMTNHARHRHLQASNNHDAWDALDDITAPTLVLHGSDDRMAPVGNAALLADRIADATVRVFTGARHAYFEECHHEAGPAVTEFLGR